MPVIKSAKKKLRQDKKRQTQNKGVKVLVKSLVKSAKLEKTQEAVRKAVQAIDKASKRNILHANKAARMKSTLSKLLAGSAPVKSTKREQPVKKASTKKPTKKTTK